MHIGSNIIRLDRVDSTNRYLRSIADEVPAGTVVLALEQSRGQGRSGRVWNACRGKSLTFSFLLQQSHDDFPMTFYMLFPAVAVVHYLLSLDVPARIKWPNDVIVKGRKIGGILVQTISRSTERRMITGIGLNVLQETQDFPQNIRDTAGSILGLTGKKIDPEKLFLSLLSVLETMHRDLQHSDGWPQLLKMWSDNCAHMNEPITIYQSGAVVRGDFDGLDEDGFAVIKTKTKKLVIKDYNRVTLRRTHDTRD